MRAYSYVVARDFGFAPNPYFGFCTLATCKPMIRGYASTGDWVIGTGAKIKYNFAGRLIFAMQVSEVLDFNAYWDDPRFLLKRPYLNGSLKAIYGDNIYHESNNQWMQADSHHSFEGGSPNQANIDNDTSQNRILVGTKFVYFGNQAPVIPKEFRSFKGEDICKSHSGHKILQGPIVTAFVCWLEEKGRWGVQGEPLEFKRHQRFVSPILP